MFSAFVITLREGVEIALVLAVILAYIKQLGVKGASSKVWLGAGVAALICVLAAVGIIIILGTTDIESFQAVLEGSLKILAVIILTWMTTLWMKSLGGELKRQVNEAVSGGSIWTLASLAFISVIREGIETVLFIASTAQGSKAIGIVGGSLAGFGVAAMLGYLLYRGTHRLPLKTFFTAMSILLLFMAAGLLAGGIHEFQELKLLPEGIEHVWSTAGILDQKSTFGSLMKTIFGYYDSPNLVQVLAYCSYLVVVLYAFFRPTKTIKS